MAEHDIQPKPTISPAKRLLAHYRQLPLPGPLRRYLSAIYRGALLRPLHRLRHRLQQRDTLAHINLKSLLGESRYPDYMIWGVIDWNFRHQRPQQLAKMLSARGRRVFYVSSTLKDSRQAGFSISPLNEHGNLFEIQLHVSRAPSIYSTVPSAEQITQLRKGLGKLLLCTRPSAVVALIHHPFWLEVAKATPNSRLVYDCIDHHEGFSNTHPGILKLEQQLIREAQLTVYTSDWLARQWDHTPSKHSVVVRNAADYGFFSIRPTSVYQDPAGRRIIGYYGAIADWFDTGLVAAVAKAFPQHLILLIGADTANARRELRQYPNVSFTGEVPYGVLPGYLHAMDVCLLPFRITPLTLATNPVKVYEYLSAGKPVVAVDLPEIEQFGSLVHRARNEDEFIASIALGLAEQPGEQGRQRRAFAAEQSWAQRIDTLLGATEGQRTANEISVIVVTYNNLALTRECLASLIVDGRGSELEIIVVDNGSHDGTPEFLRQWAKDNGQRVILNATNLGFSAANNQGLAAATGDYLVLLNNDTQVTPGWADTLRKHLDRNPGIGLIGPVTNNIGNQARIDIEYSLPDMARQACLHTYKHLGEWFRLPTVAFFCVMLRRSTYAQVGPLDEAFGCGFFEDDDYCRRVEQIGLFNACARDVFVHHHLSASFNLMDAKERTALFERNKAIYESKWGKWIPHSHG
ncbi:glycosyltransferase [Pseudomonas gingeri]|uniref:Glycosyltransferase n=1 Tax=Pseudomonas gingeri TaxID=117681 RepID=A0A7Y7YFX4_9PSED|nr:glycosyltransferase [Pseudomonas gingeri]NWA02619.1 glycosyltransferase [Pseudomonas gingeri]NWA12208.1 glycosyltransferase [Pseudomonas gingeri]NWA57386.1 glycosyltransferase [Pseudomonas gingeri]NWA93729.1 glycosyltransferase [Pseudomonas gingeri]NWB03201.1 glycosyltransferase [Pseudomonas gingeri]